MTTKDIKTFVTVKAKDLRIGDEILTLDNQIYEVVSIGHPFHKPGLTAKDQPVIVYKERWIITVISRDPKAQIKWHPITASNDTKFHKVKVLKVNVLPTKKASK